MARKSRKNIIINEEKNTNTYNVGAYVRLSSQDNSKDTDSIHLQKRRILDYIDDNNDMKLYAIYEDNGATGTNFERDGFNRMMEDIKNKKVNCIIVKDLSRFGRDYIAIGNYLEKVFPFLEVRFISLADNFDTFDAEKVEDGYLIPIINLMNEIYAKDVSKKIGIQKLQMMKKGEFAGGMPVYGYKRSKMNVRKLEIDEDVEHIVKGIFESRAAGTSYTRIAKQLIEDNVDSPSIYKYKKGLVKSEKFKESNWSTMVVKRILTNEVYVGHMVQGKTKKSTYLGESSRKLPENEYLTVLNSHQGIVSQELFDKVQQINEKSLYQQKQKLEKTKHLEGHENVLQGLIFCGHCGSRLYSGRILSSKVDKIYNYYFCWKGQYGYRFADACTEYKRVSCEEVLEVVEQVLKSHAEHLIETTQKLAEHASSAALANVENSHRRRTEIQKQLKRMNLRKQKNLESYLTDAINDNYYLEFNEIIDSQIKEMQVMLDDIYSESEFDKKLLSKADWTILFEEYLKNTELTSDMAKLLIEKVIVYSSKNIEIVLKYKDEYDKLMLKAEVCKDEV